MTSCVTCSRTVNKDQPPPGWIVLFEVAPEGYRALGTLAVFCGMDCASKWIDVAKVVT